MDMRIQDTAVGSAGTTGSTAVVAAAAAVAEWLWSQ
jgi:hypothetical protein